MVVTPTNVEPEDRSYYSVSRRIADETPNAFYANQYHNPSNPETHYVTTGPELYAQLDGDIDVFIAGMGTGTPFRESENTSKESPNVKIIGVDPVGSIYYDFFKTGQMTEATLVLEGIGEDFLPSTMDFTHLDDVVTSTTAVFEMTTCLPRRGLVCGRILRRCCRGRAEVSKTVDRPDLKAVVLLPILGLVTCPKSTMTSGWKKMDISTLSS